MHMAVSPHQRLEDFREDESNAKDLIAEEIAFHVYGRHYDDLPPAVRSRVEGAALRAIRSPQAAWMSDALRRAHVSPRWTQEMGPMFAMQAPEARQAQIRIAVSIVVGALISVLEVERPFDGPGDLLKIYEAADAAIREVK